VRVGVKGHARGGVTEMPLHHFHVSSLLHQERGARMPKVVDAESSRKAGSVNRLRPMAPTPVLMTQWRTVGTGKYRGVDILLHVVLEVVFESQSKDRWKCDGSIRSASGFLSRSQSGSPNLQVCAAPSRSECLK
jgi:hypothetical protein